jgi:hypothetical protein
MRRLREEYGIPEPFDKVVFALICIISAFLFKKVMGMMFGNRGPKSSFRFNSPDFAEIGVLVTTVKKLQEDIFEIKKSIG